MKGQLGSDKLGLFVPKHLSLCGVFLKDPFFAATSYLAAKLSPLS